MNTILKVIFLFLPLISCYNGTKEDSKIITQTNPNDSLKLVTLAVKVKPQKGTILNLANQFYDNLELRFFNDSSVEKTIYRTLSITRTKLITQFGIYMPTPNIKLSFQHAFLLTKEYDTVHITVTDSLDILFSEKNKRKINFIDKYTNELASIKDVKEINEIDRRHEKAILETSKTNFSVKEKKELLCYIEQTYLYSILRFINLNKSNKSLPDNYISSFTKFLTQYDSVISPNLQLLEIFRILKNAFESENNSSNNHCKSFGYVTRLKEVFNNYIAQAYILYDLKSSIEKNNPCWNQVSQHLTSTIYYEKNKEKVDSILFINTHVSSKSNIALFKLIDLNKKNIDFQQLLLLKKKKLYLLDFWATWCVPCKKEDEILNSKTKSISSQIGVIKISLDDDKNIDLWKKMANKDGFHFKAVGGFENEFCKYFKITEIPRYMLVNSSGELIDENFYRPSDTLFIKYLNASVK